ncbi:YqiA/YcfP family alpha/beta fold hydrolase [Burkholderia alba]|uniref:YqiA/YcfP family alpha/beta fold hydrolase n=1 Tax=Burkholderia alba TaxID=2683677 RepID=UPI002B05C182|nr:YqiA/YcfP family alpha/beta fold hydrolase [Burkholderia alba]
MILYLHGFRSSPQSAKSQALAARLAALGRSDEWRCPMLSMAPLEAVAAAEAEVAGAAPGDVTVIGSSLGGYYATWLAERHGWRAVLLNPATEPQRDLEQHLGEQPLWHGGGSIVVERHHLDELNALRVAAVTRPERYYLFAATGDEVLDYRDMLAHYPGVRTRLIEGSDHGISEFADYIDDVIAFCDAR